MEHAPPHATAPPLDADGRPDLQAGLGAVRQAAERLRDVARQTPTVYSYTFSESAGRDVWLKLENLQRTGSFKVRGAMNKVLALEPEVRERGLVAASAGNHAQGLALAAQLAGVRATVCMPESTAIVKVRRTESYGAEVVLVGHNYDEAQRHARGLAEADGRTLVHPYDDFEIMAGQGTVSLEILEQLPEVDAIVVPVGGGGLIAGMALALKALRPEVRLVGVQARGAAPMVHSLAAGHIVRVEDPVTIAEGIRVGVPGQHTFPIVRALVDDVVCVDEEEITDAVLQTMQMSKVVAEAAGVAAIAALAAGHVREARRVCAVVSGGNIDMQLLGRILESGLANQGYYHDIVVRVPDAPGALHDVLDVLRDARCNILDIQHNRAGWRVPVGFVDVEVLVETRHQGQGREVDERLVEAGLRLLPHPRFGTT